MIIEKDSRLMRILLLIQILREYQQHNDRGYTIEEIHQMLQDRLGIDISKRTIYNDINDLVKKFDAPLRKYTSNRRKYYSLPPNWRLKSLDEKILNRSEILTLLLLFKNMSSTRVFEEVIFRLQQEFPQLGHILEHIMTSTEQVVYWSENPDLEKNNLFDDLYYAILTRQVMQIVYSPFREEQRQYEFHPWYLKEYNQRWFVIGHSPEAEAYHIHPLILALDRIEELKPLKDIPYKESDIDINSYFDDVIGITKHTELPVMCIDFVVSPELYPYIKTKPLHHTQRSKWQETEYGWFRNSIRVVPNYELFNRLLSFGPHLRVLGPPSVEEYLAILSRHMHENYTQDLAQLGSRFHSFPSVVDFFTNHTS